MFHRIVSALLVRGIDLLAGSNHTDGWHIEMSLRAETGKMNNCREEKPTDFNSVSYMEPREEVGLWLDDPVYKNCTAFFIYFLLLLV